MAATGRWGGALSRLLDRKPYLLGPLAAQLLPPALASDPAMRLGIDLSAEDLRQVLGLVWAALSRGDIAPAEGVRIARRARSRLRAVRSIARLARRLRLTGGGGSR